MIGRTSLLAVGIVLVIGLTALWHGPAGTADRIADRIESAARAELDRLEMTEIDARLARQPLTRTLLLSGPADDFQQTELVRIMGTIPGAGGARWVDDNQRRSDFDLPLLLIAELMALVGFSIGLLFAYLVELRRRANAEWRW